MPVRILAWLIGIPVAILAIVFAVVNRQLVTVDLWPLPWTVSLPLFLMVLGAMGLGLAFGGAVVWISAGAARKRARAEGRRADRLDSRVRALETENQRLNQQFVPAARDPSSTAARALPPA